MNDFCFPMSQSDAIIFNLSRTHWFSSKYSHFDGAFKILMVRLKFISKCKIAIHCKIAHRNRKSQHIAAFN